MSETMGQRIYNLRKQRGLTLEELGKLVGVGKSTVRKWENGMIANMGRDKIAKLAEVFNVSPAWLMGYEDNNTSDTVSNTYYLDPETAKAAQEVFDDPDLRVLFDAARGSRPEDIRMAADMLRRFKETNPGG